ncbi:nuclear speckle splicing regulatory protein 1 [Sitodiplosis mosellana]|uniref:nuclear speckle splicing regulatory protein 1 n=1 Tax=Sitodiplosis mosellana TaxID=263140 RepID=UPI0024446B7B|nr:nuclear speckle splicing regulatory protein 1 [Sitodiplosis mosellana]
MTEKQYGLIKPQKPTTRLMAFASDSESDDEPAAKKKISIGESVTQKRQARIIQQDALKIDPTIFQYDELYDEMTANREEAKKAKSNVNRESKYINKLLVAAEKRKIEYETRIERKVQKEREAEGDQFKDKEVFVTASYREKLEAMKKAEEVAQREEYLENIGDVLKQRDLSGFYRHMYEQKLGNDKNDEVTTEPDGKKETLEVKKKDNQSGKRRMYRKHSDHENSDDEQSTSKASGESASKKVHLQSNLDADSDFSIDSSSDSEDNDEEKASDKTNQITGSPSNADKMDKSNKTESKEEHQKIESAENGAVKNEGKKDAKESNGGEKSEEEKMPPPKEVKPKVDIWKKRTVGEIYLNAVKRYYERKQAAA